MSSAILMVGLTGTMTMISQADSATVSSRAREGATNLQRELIEAARSIPYDNLTLNSIGQRVRSQAGLGDATLDSAGWTVRRRGMTYTVAMGACAVDDPRDGVGAHEPGVFCATGAGGTSPQACLSLLRTSTDGLPGESAPTGVTAGDCGIDSNFDGTVDSLVDGVGTNCTGTCDSNPADYKRIVSLVRWDRGGGARYVLQGATVANPGIAAAPAISELAAGVANQVTSATSIPFTSTVSPTPAAVSWYLDGTQQAPASGAGSAWTFSWALGTVSSGTQPSVGEVVDGSYQVGAKAFDQYGLAGTLRSVTVVLNRRAAYPPQNLEGGRNNGAVDLQWSPNKERDLAGYRAYRIPAGGGAAVEVCALTSHTACQDPSPPAGATIQYYVVGVDRDALGALREGAQSSPVTVTDTNTPPPAPPALSASTASGNTILSWTAPAGGDPDPGDQIDHYVIYRDGQLYADRYDRTSTATELSFTDTHTNGLVHTYWVAAVDTQLAESPLVGPVTK